MPDALDIAVCVKQTPDTEARIVPAPDGQSVAVEEGSWIISPHDETAVELALRLRQECGGSVTVYSLGPERVERAIREALAMGADRGVHLRCDVMPEDGAQTAEALAGVLGGRGHGLILTGEQAIDTQAAQVPQRLAMHLDLPCITAVESVDISEGRCEARRMVEGAEERVRCALPAVLGINRRLAEPRYPSFRGIMQAKRKPVETVAAAPGKSGLRTVAAHLPVGKAAGRILAYDDDAVGVLVGLLREEAKVI